MLIHLVFVLVRTLKQIMFLLQCTLVCLCRGIGPIMFPDYNEMVNVEIGPKLEEEEDQFLIILWFNILETVVS